jgi:Protein of unknown function (DUF3551)
MRVDCACVTRRRGKITVLAIVLLSFAALALGADRAAAAGAAWCLRSGDSGGGGCTYHTFEQCQASRAGGSSHCSPNPYPSNPSGGDRARR